MMSEQLKPGMLTGTAYHEEVEVNANGQVYKILIHPLSYTESEEIEALLSKGITVKGDGRSKDKQEVSVDTSMLVRYKKKALLKAAALGTVEKGWTEKTIVDEWKNEWISLVGQQVMNISGIHTPEEKVKQFRTNN